MRLIENPPAEMVRKWGPLAYITDDERERILNVGFGNFKPTVAALEREIKEMKKRNKAKHKE